MPEIEPHPDVDPEVERLIDGIAKATGATRHGSVPPSSPPRPWDLPRDHYPERAPVAAWQMWISAWAGGLFFWGVMIGVGVLVWKVFSR
jgi:hypothetical protein